MNFNNVGDWYQWVGQQIHQQVQTCCCDPSHECWTPPVGTEQTIQLFSCVHCGTHTSNRYLGQPCCEECAKHS